MSYHVTYLTSFFPFPQFYRKFLQNSVGKSIGELEGEPSGGLEDLNFKNNTLSFCQPSVFASRRSPFLHIELALYKKQHDNHQTESVIALEVCGSGSTGGFVSHWIIAARRYT